jgi:glycosyltransferase involved in cell wall biosynthesis
MEIFMRKVGICGHFNIGYNAVGGQTIRTRSISKLLEDIYGPEQVIKVDTANWKRRAPILFFQCISMALRSEHMIILPAKKGVKLLVPLFVLLSLILRKRLHYIIVGAWLPDILEQHRYLIKPIIKIDYIYAQTNTLLIKLSNMGLHSNTYLMPNFKNSNPSFFDFKLEKLKKPYRLCIISRINFKKGIESAVRVINRINREEIQNAIELDIYGPIEENYKERFERFLNQYCHFVKYKGIVDYNKTPEVIKDYYLLLFPTQYYTEGFPGTILDAYLSGVPVLASRWESSSDVIREGITGYTYEFNNDEDFYLKLKNLLQNERMVIDLKNNCLYEAEKYKADNAIKVLLENIDSAKSKCKKINISKKKKKQNRNQNKEQYVKRNRNHKKRHKKRIGLLVPNLQSGGTERVISLISQLLTEAGHDVFILLFDAANISYPYQGTLIPLNCKGGNNTIQKGLHRILRVAKLSYYMQRYDLEIVVSFLYAANAVNYYSIGKAKKILTCRGYSDYIKNGRTYSKMLKNTQSILVQTERMKSDFIKDFKVKDSQIYIIGNPYNTKEIRDKSSDSIEVEIQNFIDTHKTLCAVGSFKKDKGYWHLIRIFLEVKKAVPEVGLIFIGNRGEMEEDIKNMASRTQHARDILFLGYQDNPFRYVAKCDLYVSTSIYEGFPNSMMEAMACGVPVIATDCKTGPREILCKTRRESNGVEVLEMYGTLVPELSEQIDFDIAAIDHQELVMANEITSLLQEENRLERYKVASLRRSEEFDSGGFSTKLLSIIEK